jgi:uncharacterized protein (DUF983 family)
MTKLVQGKIPAFTDCPFRARCPSGTNGKCYQQGVKHPVPYSCGTARMFNIFLAKV